MNQGLIAADGPADHRVKGGIGNTLRRTTYLRLRWSFSDLVTALFIFCLIIFIFLLKSV